MEKVNLREKFSLFDEQWTPKIVAEVGDMHVKLISGEFSLEIRGRSAIRLGPGEVLVVP